jgi:hypothetical protein
VVPRLPIHLPITRRAFPVKVSSESNSETGKTAGQRGAELCGQPSSGAAKMGDHAYYAIRHAHVYIYMHPEPEHNIHWEVFRNEVVFNYYLYFSGGGRALGLKMECFSPETAESAL